MVDSLPPILKQTSNIRNRSAKTMQNHLCTNRAISGYLCIGKGIHGAEYVVAS